MTAAAGAFESPAITERVRRLTPERPFPGPFPYREPQADEERYFWGRDDETEKLLRLTRRNALSILFGASGLGKTSLLSAGLFPHLREAGCLPIFVRLKHDHHDPASLLQQIMGDTRAAAHRGGVEVENGEDQGTLWEYFQRLELWNGSARLLTPVIVLDQFEEVFTLGAESSAAQTAVERLFEALGDLTENRIPIEVERRGQGAEGLGGHSLLRVDNPRTPLVKVVVSLREEYLPHLEAYREQMPSVVRNRMRLLPLRGPAAKQAVWRSALHLLAGENVAESIVRAVAARRRATEEIGGEARALSELRVDPALLNLFCYQLNERHLKLREGARGAEKPRGKIDEVLVASSGEDILSDFYAETMRGFGAKVRRFVEVDLLSENGYRLPVPRQVALTKSGITASVLAMLQDRRLIRADTREDSVYIELVHDVLAQTIVDARARRRTAATLRWLRWGLRTLLVLFVVGALVVAVIVKTEGQAALGRLNSDVRERTEEVAKLDNTKLELEGIKVQLEGDRKRLELELDETRRRLLLARTEAAVQIEKAQAETAAAEQRAKAAQKELLELAAQRDRMREAIERDQRELKHREKLQGIPPYRESE